MPYTNSARTEMRREHERGWLTWRLLSTTVLGAWPLGTGFANPLTSPTVPPTAFGVVAMHWELFSKSPLDFRPDFGRILDGSTPPSKGFRACLTARKETIRKP